MAVEEETLPPVNFDFYLRCSTSYGHAIELGRYRAASRLALIACRDPGSGEQWRNRLRGSLKRRHRG